VPTYDYQCRSCGHTIEVIHSMTEDGPATCERCGGELRRVLYPTGIIFKGSGFYKTDSRASAGGSASSASGKASSEKPAVKGDSGSAAAGGDAAPTAPPAPSAKQESAGG
jgi:putative FmdB family regulatory protein